MAQMTDEEAYDFLGAGTRTGHLATTRADGRAHVKPVWFVLDGTPEGFRVLFNTGANTVAGRNLARDPRVTLSVDDPHPPFAFVLVEGTAELITDPDVLLESATEIAARYVGPARAEDFGKRNGVPGELLVRITPSKIVALRDMTD
jgi:PPOX class probable F420-dependent enzyme